MEGEELEVLYWSVDIPRAVNNIHKYQFYKDDILMLASPFLRSCILTADIVLFRRALEIVPVVELGGTNKWIGSCEPHLYTLLGLVIRLSPAPAGEPPGGGAQPLPGVTELGAPPAGS